MSVKTPQRRREEKARLLATYQRATEVPMLVLALAMLPLLVLPLLMELPKSVETTFFALDWVVWAAFAIDYLIRLSLVERRWHFVGTHLPDLLIVIVPFLRPLRILRSTRALRALRVFRSTIFFGVAGRNALRLLTRHKLHLLLLIVLLITIGAAGLVLYAEDEPGSSIKNFGDSIWWALSTLTTVGYGDKVPVSDAGRGIGIFLMISGVILFSALAANIAAFLVEGSEPPKRTEEDVGTVHLTNRVDEILRRLDELAEQLTLPPSRS
jgi:voltage-gated potassium channel